jgi:hypothetical protein
MWLPDCTSESSESKVILASSRDLVFERCGVFASPA